MTTIPCPAPTQPVTPATLADLVLRRLGEERIATYEAYKAWILENAR